MTGWVVTSPDAAGRGNGVADYAAILATEVGAQVVVPGAHQARPDAMRGILHQYSPSAPQHDSLIAPALEAGIPVIVTVHEYWPPADGTPRRAWLRWRCRRRLRRLAARATGIVVTQEISARELVEAGVVASESISIVPVGSNIRRTASPAVRDGGIVMFGQPAAFRSSLLSTFARWRASQTPMPAFTWLGRSTDELTRAWRAAGGGGEHARLRGALTEAEVSDVLARSTLGIGPYADGASARRTTLAALLAHGVPTVVTDGVATDSWLKGAGVAGVPDNDATAFTRATASLWGDPASRDRLSSDALVLYAKHMDWSHARDTYRRLMQRAREATR